MKVLNTKIPGKLVLCFRKLKKVPLVQLRNGFSKFPTPDILFHTRLLGKKIIANGGVGKELKK